MTDLDCNKTGHNRSKLCDDNLDGSSVLKRFADEEELKNLAPDYGSYYDIDYSNDFSDREYYDKLVDGDYETGIEIQIYFLDCFYIYTSDQEMYTFVSMFDHICTFRNVIG